jgi:WD40 repeat protein
MSALCVTPRHLFGVNSAVKGCVSYREEQTVVYPCGHSVVEYNTDTRSQRIVHGGPASGGITALATHPSRKFTAFAERGPHPVVTIWDWQSMRPRRKITTLDLGTTDTITSLSFSSDGKALFVQGGGPDWLLVCLGWEKAKSVASQRVSTPAGAVVNQVDSCPDDPTAVCVSGAGFVRLYKLTDAVFKPHAVNIKTPPQNYCCHTWLPDGRLVVGGGNGELLLFENLEFRCALAQVGPRALLLPLPLPARCLGLM